MARIVIAEDQNYIRHLLAMWMTRHGHEVHEAGTGSAALNELRRHPIDLLITDVNMPEFDGIQLVQVAFEACPTLRRAFVVTARCDQKELLAQVSDPRVSVFPKPFSPSQLLREVETALVASASEAPRTAAACRPGTSA